MLAITSGLTLMYLQYVGIYKILLKKSLDLEKTEIAPQI